LATAVAAKPWLIKPNREELAELAGRKLPALRDVVDTARKLISSGVGIVVVSLGADGALWVDSEMVHHARATVEGPRSTVGAGDWPCGRTLAAGDRPPRRRRRPEHGVAWGAAAVSLPGSAVPGPAEIDAVRVTSISTPDLDTRLSS